VLGLFVALAVTFGAAALGSLFTTPSIAGWYARLPKPSWTPPNWLFAPVWTALYASMAVAAWLVWRKEPGRARRTALVLFAVQLVLNVAWTGLFFAARLPGLAFVEICLLWLAILTTIGAFWRVSPICGAILVPYLAWVSFAAALNLAIWWMQISLFLL
jgi:tryptophan-rich sensory protein